MNPLSKEQMAYAVASLQPAMDNRGFNQQDLHSRSHVAQSTISRILSPSTDERYQPSEETLRKLFKGLGLDLDKIIGETDAFPNVSPDISLRPSLRSYKTSGQKSSCTVL